MLLNPNKLGANASVFLLAVTHFVEKSQVPDLTMCVAQHVALKVEVEDKQHFALTHFTYIYCSYQ